MDEIMEVSEDKLFSGLGKFMNDYIQQFDDSDQDIILDLLANYYIAGMIESSIMKLATLLYSKKIVSLSLSKPVISFDNRLEAVRLSCQG